MRFTYPDTASQSADGAWQVRFPDVPEALTEGDTEAEAHTLAPDALLAALGGLVKMKRDLPSPSAPEGRPTVILPILPSAKLALWQAMREHGLNNVTLARMLDLDHQTKIGTLENALRVLGRQMTCEVRQAA